MLMRNCHDTPTQLADKLAALCELYIDKRLKVGLLYWDSQQPLLVERPRGVDKVIQLLKDNGVHAERHEGVYYDSYAESDCDLCVICGKDPAADVMELSVNTSPQSNLKIINNDLDNIAFQFKVYDIIYGKGNYEWWYHVETSRRIDIDNTDDMEGFDLHKSVRRYRVERHD